ncbi:MAG: hypothetical protein K8W52_35460 [Deltaproteobacteria bacterium]|nr:hypothetical protein [Deltaproteobacteria bacterium]
MTGYATPPIGAGVVELLEARDHGVWLLSYTLTHRYAKLALSAGSPRGPYLDCIGCNYISGRLDSGPYHLTVSLSPDGIVSLVGVGAGGEFVLRCDWIRLGDPPT